MNEKKDYISLTISQKIQIYELLQPMIYETVLLLALKQQKSEKYIEDENVNRMHFSRTW